MGKCLVTKLNGTVNNGSLLRLGEMRIHISRIDSPTGQTQGMTFSFTKNTDLEILGDGYFTDSTLSENKGKKITIGNTPTYVYVSNGDFDVCILDKYSVKNIYMHSTEVDQTYRKDGVKTFDISQLYYCTNLEVFVALHDTLVGDISSLKNCSKLNILLIADNSKISGDISVLKDKTLLTDLNMSYSSKVEGDISNLSNLVNLEKLDFNYCRGIYGNITSLKDLSKVKELNLEYCIVNGDLSQVNANCCYVDLTYSHDSKLTWTARPSSANVISFISSGSMDNIDKMLQDQANCVVPNYSRKTMVIGGNRTSASDEAVSNLQSKGYTISISKA